MRYSLLFQIMAKRIVKQTLANGKVRYVVETNRLLGFIPSNWHVDTVYDMERDMNFDAIFDSYEDACIYADITVPGLEIYESIVIKE